MIRAGKSFDDYLTTVRGMSRKGAYDAMIDELLRDRLVCCIRDDTVRKTLLQKRKLTLTVY